MAGLARHLHERGYPLGPLRRPEDFDELAEQSSPGGYLGLVYADGDSLGKEIASLFTLVELQRFATEVDESLKEAAADAIQAHLQPMNSTDVLPFDALLLGGDDLIIATAAQGAIEVALSLVLRFSEITQRKLGRPLRLSACVALAHARFPLSALRRLAQGGLKLAKQEAALRRRAGEQLTTGLVNFVVVSGANHLDFSQYVELELHDRDQRLFRTLRPYAPEQLHALVRVIRNLRELDAPRGKLQVLSDACFLDRDGACLQALGALLHWSDRGKSEALGLISQFARKGGPTVPDPLPWFRDGEESRTPFVDLVELYDFIPPEGRVSAPTD